MMLSWITAENIESLAKQYHDLGPIVGFAFTFIEAFLPFLPLVVIVMANTAAYGFFWGFVLSWVGASLGAFSVFLLIRKFRQHPRIQKWLEREQVQKLIRWVDIAGISPLFVMLCFPFTPAIVVNMVAGLSNLKRKYYFCTIVVGKLVMIFMLTYVVHDITDLIRHPKKIIIVGTFLIILWCVGKLMEYLLNNKNEYKEINK